MKRKERKAKAQKIVQMLDDLWDRAERERLSIYVPRYKVVDATVGRTAKTICWLFIVLPVAVIFVCRELIAGPTDNLEFGLWVTVVCGVVILGYLALQWVRDIGSVTKIGYSKRELEILNSALVECQEELADYNQKIKETDKLADKLMRLDPIIEDLDGEMDIDRRPGYFTVEVVLDGQKHSFKLSDGDPVYRQIVRLIDDAQNLRELVEEFEVKHGLKSED